MIWQSEWEIKTKIFEYCEGWKALCGDIDSYLIAAVYYYLTLKFVAA